MEPPRAPRHAVLRPVMALDIREAARDHRLDARLRRETGGPGRRLLLHPVSLGITIGREG